MLSSALKKYALEKGMTISHGAAYGSLDGFLVTLRDGMDEKSASFAVTLPDNESREQVLRALASPETVQKYRLAAPVVTPETITVVFIDGIGVMKNVSGFLRWFPAVLSENGGIGDGTCACCHEALADDEASLVMADSVAMRLHPSCAGRLRDASPNPEPVKKHVGRGLLGAVLGMLIAIIPWIIVTAFNWSMVGWLGFLVGLLAKKGYEILGGKPTKAKFPIILIVSIVGILLAQFTGQAINLYFALQEIGYMVDFPTLLLSTLGTYQYGWLYLMEGGTFLQNAWLSLGLPVINVLVGIALAFLCFSNVPKEARIHRDNALPRVLLLDGAPLPEPSDIAGGSDPVSEDEPEEDADAVSTKEEPEESF